MIGRIVGAVDPGLRACGLALARMGTGELLGAWLVKNPEQDDAGAVAWLAMGTAIARALETCAPMRGQACLDLLVVEHMAIRGSAKRGLITRNPSAMIGLQAITGVILGRVPASAVEAVYPSEWQGRWRGKKSAAGEKLEPGHVIWNCLADAEKARAPDAAKKSTGHNILDAIGMSKWAALREENGELF